MKEGVQEYVLTRAVGQLPKGAKFRVLGTVLYSEAHETFMDIASLGSDHIKEITGKSVKSRRNRK